MDKLTAEVTERTQDIEIKYSDLEKQLQSQLEQLRVEAEAD